MAKTDRQTDKATWWSVTAYNDEIDLLADNTKWPELVKEVHGGREECPETGKIHFQGLIILRSQQRLSWFKSWLPTSHLQVCRDKAALKKYVMKSETAIGEKTVQLNAHKYYSADEICIELARSIYDDVEIFEEAFAEKGGVPKDYYFEQAVIRLLCKDRKLAGQLMNPSLRKWFAFTKEVWFGYVLKERKALEELAAP